jgi:hypothetical protein
MKPPYFSLKIRLLFTDLFRIRIRIRNVYFGSRSDPEPAKSFGYFRIRIRNTAIGDFLLVFHYNLLQCERHWYHIVLTSNVQSIRFFSVVLELEAVHYVRYRKTG